MEEIGLSPDSLELVIITHHHYDHVDGLRRIRGATGARVAAHRDEALFIESNGYQAKHPPRAPLHGQGPTSDTHPRAHTRPHSATRSRERGIVHRRPRIREERRTPRSSQAPFLT